jgi:hypothetical protein
MIELYTYIASIVLNLVRCRFLFWSYLWYRGPVVHVTLCFAVVFYRVLCRVFIPLSPMTFVWACTDVAL